MPVTKQTYTAIAPWTPTSLAQAFEDAFIGAGLMTDWYDEFTSGGFEHRILEIVYDGTKTYGKAYYWFLFSGQEVFYSVATGWNTTTNVPIGDVYLDFINASTTTADTHLRFALLNSLTSTTVTRYTSQANANFTWFYVRCGTANFNFHISRAAPNSWIDLDKAVWHPLMHVRTGVAEGYGFAFFNYGKIRLRRSYIGNRHRPDQSQNTFVFYGVDSTTSQSTWQEFSTHQFVLAGNTNQANTANLASFGSRSVILPVWFANSNPAYTTDVNPVWSGLPLSLYSPEVLPSDFGIAGHLTSNTMAAFDQYVVTPAVEVYDILQVTNHPALDRRSSPLFLARTV